MDTVKRKLSILSRYIDWRLLSWRELIYVVVSKKSASAYVNSIAKRIRITHFIMCYELDTVATELAPAIIRDTALLGGMGFLFQFLIYENS